MPHGLSVGLLGQIIAIGGEADSLERRCPLWCPNQDQLLSLKNTYRAKNLPQYVLLVSLGHAGSPNLFTENPRVGGSIPPLATNLFPVKFLSACSQ